MVWLWAGVGPQRLVPLAANKAQGGGLVEASRLALFLGGDVLLLAAFLKALEHIPMAGLLDEGAAVGLLARMGTLDVGLLLGRQQPQAGQIQSVVQEHARAEGLARGGRRLATRVSARLLQTGEAVAMATGLALAFGQLAAGFVFGVLPQVQQLLQWKDELTHGPSATQLSAGERAA
jgi:hypothetical protein